MSAASLMSALSCRSAGAVRPPPRRLMPGRTAGRRSAPGSAVRRRRLPHHHHPAVVQQQFIADPAVLHQVRVVDADHFLGTGVAGVAGGEAELSPTCNSMRLLANLAMRIGPCRSPSRATKRPRASSRTSPRGRGVHRGAVGEVEAGDVDPGQDQLLQHFRGIAGWAEVATILVRRTDMQRTPG